MIERELIILKPDAICRGLIGELISRFERKGLKIIAMKMLKLTVEQAKKLYDVHKDKAFYNELVNYMSSAPVIAMIVEGDDAIFVVRNLIGLTDGKKASPGSIRGDFSVSNSKNLVHASDSKEAFEKEAYIFFSNEEIIEYRLPYEDFLK
jgi:nucleoside-diphosphate kinase